MTGFLRWLRSIMAAVFNGIAKFAFLLIVIFVALLVIGLAQGDGLPKNTVLTLDLRDSIADSAATGLSFSGTQQTVMNLVFALDNASRDSRIKGVVMRLPDGTNAEQLELTKALLINHDAPEHTRLRKIVSRLFTPRAVATLEEKLAVAAREIVAAAAEKESGNFFDDIAMSLPLLAIADLIGVPEADRAKLFHWTNSIMNTDDPDYETDYAAANAELMGYAYTMAEERRRCPADDIVTRLIEADIDGESMDDVEFAFFVILLAVAGNETTRNAMTHGMNAFFENPDQWELYKRDRPATSADEIVRWATPVHCFQRTALADTELGGVTIREGQRAGLFYSSANYDENVFEYPFVFNILRDPNPHLGFGGNGAHYCIGANLARMEIKLIFNEIANQIPDIAKLSEPQRLRSGWINGVKELQVSYRG